MLAFPFRRTSKRTGTSTDELQLKYDAGSYRNLRKTAQPNLPKWMAI